MADRAPKRRRQGIRLWLFLLLCAGGLACTELGQGAANQPAQPGVDSSSGGSGTGPGGGTESGAKSGAGTEQSGQPSPGSPSGSTAARPDEVPSEEAGGEGTTLGSGAEAVDEQGETKLSPGWPWSGVFSVLGLFALAGLWCWLTRHGERAASMWRASQDRLSPTAKEKVQRISASLLSRELSTTNTELRQLRESVRSLETKVDRLGPETSGKASLSPARSAAERDFDLKGDDPGDQDGHGSSDYERRLLDVVNRWWQEGGTDRSLLIRLLDGTPFKCLKLEDLDRTFRQPTGQTYRFRSSSDTPEWLGFREPSSSSLLVVPLDIGFFQVGNSIQVVRNLFHGIGAIPSRFRFQRARKACRLELVPGEDSTYKAVERGELELDPPAATAPPSAPIAAWQTVAPERGNQDVAVALLPRLQAFLETNLQKVEMAVAGLTSRMTSLENHSMDLGAEVVGLRQDIARLQAQIGELFAGEGILAARPMGLIAECKIDDIPPLAKIKAPTEDVYERTMDISSRKMTGPVRPPAISQETAKAFSESIREGLAELVQQGAGNFEAFGEKAAGQYLAELVSLLARIRRDGRFKHLVIQLVHLQVDSTPGGESRVKLEAAEPDLGTASAQVGSRQLRGTLLFQFGLSVSQQGGDLAAFLLARGAWPSRFHVGFDRLMEPTAPAGGQVVRLLEPAILRRQDALGNLYLVERPLRVELESLGNA